LASLGTKENDVIQLVINAMLPDSEDSSVEIMKYLGCISKAIKV